MGFCSDLLAALGGTPVLAETPEIIGAEHLLVRRARSREVAEKLFTAVHPRLQAVYLSRFAGSFDDNPSPGNKAGGLSNILEKSLGAVAEGRHFAADGCCYGYAEQVTDRPASPS